jgi:hypothetical protein
MIARAAEIIFYHENTKTLDRVYRISRRGAEFAEKHFVAFLCGLCGLCVRPCLFVFSSLRAFVMRFLYSKHSILGWPSPALSFVISLLRIRNRRKNDLLTGKDMIEISDSGIVLLDQLEHPVSGTTVDSE